MTETQSPPDRFVDAENYGWWQVGSDDPDAVLYASSRDLMATATYEVAVAAHGPVRPVAYPSTADVEALNAALRGAGRKAVTTLLAALGKVWNSRIPHPGPDVDSDVAIRSLTAGRPGSWESALIPECAGFGRDLYLGSPKRVDAEALEPIVEILDRWTSGPEYVEIAETLAVVVGDIADELGPDAWKKLADQWLQPQSLAHDDFAMVYRLLFSTSKHFDPGLIS